MMNSEKKICKRCLLKDMAEADYKKIEKYKDAIKKDDRVSENEYEQRLQICKECDNLNEGTCNACGCYVELRALGKISSCPYNKW